MTNTLETKLLIQFTYLHLIAMLYKVYIGDIELRQYWMSACRVTLIGVQHTMLCSVQ